MKAGFKTHNPSKVYERLKISEYGRKEWYKNDGHYYDVPFVFMYLVSTAVELGLLAALASFLGL